MAKSRRPIRTQEDLWDQVCSEPPIETGPEFVEHFYDPQTGRFQVAGEPHLGPVQTYQARRCRPPLVRDAEFKLGLTCGLVLGLFLAWLF